MAQHWFSRPGQERDLIVPQAHCASRGMCRPWIRKLGDLYGGAVLVEDGRIAAVGPSLDKETPRPTSSGSAAPLSYTYPVIDPVSTLSIKPTRGTSNW